MITIILKYYNKYTEVDMKKKKYLIYFKPNYF